MNDQNSILDKVISSKNTADMLEFNPSEIISALLKSLSGKEEDILRRRFGLNGKEKETLESIGEAYQVTRERIRQIENTAIKNIKNLKEFTGVSSQVEHVIYNEISQNGGIMEENSLLSELLNFSSDNQINRNCTLFMLDELLLKKINKIIPTENFKKCWALPYISIDFIGRAINEAVDIVKNENKPMMISEMLKKYYASQYYQENRDKLSDEAVVSYINLSAKIDKNPFNEYGLMEWGTINPKRMRDKVYLVLKKEGKPLHFNKITELINKIGFDNRKAYAPTVHNELILNDNFVLVGRGIYALKEWGYKPGVVIDVLVDILKKANHPMSRDELVKMVLEQRVVRKNTIHLALMDKTKFKKLPNKLYTLADAGMEIKTI